MSKTMQMFDNAIEFFEGLPAFSFIFLDPGVTNAIGPNLISAIELAVCTFNGRPYEGPLPESEYRSQKAEAERRCAEIVEAVEKRLRYLRKSGARFIMCWQAFGEDEPHLDYPRDCADSDVREHLLGLLEEELHCQVWV